jgi:hypothetical protein
MKAGLGDQNPTRVRMSWDRQVETRKPVDGMRAHHMLVGDTVLALAGKHSHMMRRGTLAVVGGAGRIVRVGRARGVDRPTTERDT